MSLTGKNIPITGASMGIGAAIAKRLAKENANLILPYRSEDKLSALAQELQTLSNGSANNKILYYPTDVQIHAQLNSAVKKAVSALDDKPIDVLINNAGLAIGAPKDLPRS